MTQQEIGIQLNAEDWALLTNFMEYVIPDYITWNELMSVVEKIESIVFKTNNHWSQQFDGRVNTDINVTFPIVVEFIKWYNTQTSKP